MTNHVNPLRAMLLATVASVSMVVPQSAHAVTYTYTHIADAVLDLPAPGQYHEFAAYAQQGCPAAGTPVPANPTGVSYVPDANPSQSVYDGVTAVAFYIGSRAGQTIQVRVTGVDANPASIVLPTAFDAYLSRKTDTNGGCVRTGRRLGSAWDTFERAVLADDAWLVIDGTARPMVNLHLELRRKCVKPNPCPA